MRKGDLVHMRNYSYLSVEKPAVGLIIELQTRGPVPGAYVYWPEDNITEWVSVEKIKKIDDASFS